MWSIINSAKIVQNDDNPCSVGILIEDKIYELGKPAAGGANDSNNSNDSSNSNDSTVNSASVQSDWSQNDPSAPDYVKNRTHYSEALYLVRKLTIEVPEDNRTVEFGGYFNLPNLIAGKTYTVQLNDTTYTCVARAFNDAVIIGNGTFVPGSDGNAGNEEPFEIASAYSSMYFTHIVAGTYALSLSTDGDVAHKIDPKYLPDEVYELIGKDFVTREDVTSIVEENMAVIENGSY